MGVIDNLINNFKSRNQKWKEFQENDRLQNQLQERKLTHNERVLNKLMEEDRQKRIKEKLRIMEQRRKQEDLQRARDFMKFDSKLWNDNTILKTENLFKNNPTFI